MVAALALVAWNSIQGCTLLLRMLFGVNHLTLALPALADWCSAFSCLMQALLVLTGCGVIYSWLSFLSLLLAGRCSIPSGLMLPRPPCTALLSGVWLRSRAQLLRLMRSLLLIELLFGLRILMLAELMLTGWCSVLSCPMVHRTPCTGLLSRVCILRIKWLQLMRSLTLVRL